MFMINGENMPFVPPIALGVVGLLLVVTAGLGVNRDL
jgi:hypothetical protein